MARIPEIERRLLNWARWQIAMRSGGLGYATTTLRERVDGEGWDSPAVIPTNDAEASDTDQAVNALDKPVRDAVLQVYIKGDGMRDKARRLGCSEATVYARIDQAHRSISGWLRDKQLAAEAERLRVEGLQRAAVARHRSSFTD